jgi:D-alanyl-D-alanine carboxypeptidase
MLRRNKLMFRINHVNRLSTGLAFPGAWNHAFLPPSSNHQSAIMPIGSKSKFLFFIILLAFFLGSNPASARPLHHHTHKTHRHQHAGVARSASYADIVIDAESGQILHATDPDSLRHPASLTKMMTLYLTFQAIESGRVGLNQYLPISANAAEQSPSKLGLRPGQHIRLEDAILGIVTESANDAAVAVGEWLGGSESGFAAMMTRQAQALGMTRTHFNNPSGLPNDGQVTTAHDMAILGAALIYHFPQYYTYFSTGEFTYAGLTHHNHNHLMERYDGMDGIKTGYIRASGFNLVASAKRGSTRLIGVVFGGHSTLARDNRMAQLLDQAFDRVENGTISVNAPAGGAEGDSDDDDKSSTGFVSLPAKGAAVFPVQPQSSRVPKASSGSASWGVQIGAYSDPAVGRQALAALVNSAPQILGNAAPQVQKIATGNVNMYRARLMSLDQHTAEAVCASIVKQGNTCQTVAP